MIQGCLEVLKGSDKIAEISEPESYFGEMSSLLGGRRTATIRSVGKSIVKVFPGDKLMETLEGYPEISKQVIHALVARLEDTNKRFVEVLTAKTEVERTLRAVAPHAAGQASQRIPFGKQSTTAPRPVRQGPGGTAGSTMASAKAQAKPASPAATVAPRPLKKAGDQTQTIHIGSHGPIAKQAKSIQAGGGNR